MVVVDLESDPFRASALPGLRATPRRGFRRFGARSTNAVYGLLPRLWEVLDLTFSSSSPGGAVPIPVPRGGDPVPRWRVRLATHAWRFGWMRDWWGCGCWFAVLWCGPCCLVVQHTAPRCSAMNDRIEPIALTGRPAI